MPEGGRGGGAREDDGAWQTPVPIPVARVQTGVCLETLPPKAPKTSAGCHDITLGDLIEGIVLHACDGELPLDAPNPARISELR